MGVNVNKYIKNYEYSKQSKKKKETLQGFQNNKYIQEIAVHFTFQKKYKRKNRTHFPLPRKRRKIVGLAVKFME